MKIPQITIAATGTFHLGDADNIGASRFVIQFEDSSFSGSVSVQGRIVGSGATYLALDYIDRATGSVATGAITTGNKLIDVNASGLELQLNCTSFSAGSYTVSVIPLIG